MDTILSVHLYVHRRPTVTATGPASATASSSASGAREEEGANGGFRLLHGQPQPDVYRVVDADLAAEAAQGHAPEAPFLEEQSVNREGARLRSASLLLNKVGVFGLGRAQASLHQFRICRPAFHDHLLLQEHEHALHDQLRDEGRVLALLDQVRTHVGLDQIHDLLPCLDLLQALLVDRHGLRNGVLRLDHLGLLLIGPTDLLLLLGDDPVDLDAELLFTLLLDLARAVLGLRGDEANHLGDLILRLLGIHECWLGEQQPGGEGAIDASAKMA
mmetsp:Transcript_68830/g.197357  ORF Transcript_68830/g.197357 Transcript_68830/m.197357 type:complete len:273 (-) Transcript_68830:7-825(-)